MAENNTLEKEIEALLFASGEPLSLSKLTTAVDKKKSEVKQALTQLEKRLEEKSGLRLLKTEKEVQLVAAQEHASLIEELFKNQQQEELTRASLEVLSIIAYGGPATREKIETIRGVNSSYILRRLSIRGLIQKTTRKNKSATYSISPATLRSLGITKQEELPEWNAIRARIQEAQEALNESN